jgi:hypothetical protein
VDGERIQTSETPRTPARGTTTARQFELGDLATNRILFALTLLGVLLPANAIMAHYSQINFIYVSPHSHWFKGPYHVRAVSALYLMEGLLAFAVYLYGFDFIFKIRLFEYVGTRIYGIALFVPIIYLYAFVFQHVNNSITNLGWLYWVVLVALGIPLAIVGGAIAAIGRRLED